MRICQKGAGAAKKVQIDAKTSSICPIVFDFADDMNMKLDCFFKLEGFNIQECEALR